MLHCLLLQVNKVVKAAYERSYTHDPTIRFACSWNLRCAVAFQEVFCFLYGKVQVMQNVTIGEYNVYLEWLVSQGNGVSFVGPLAVISRCNCCWSMRVSEITNEDLATKWTVFFSQQYMVGDSNFKLHFPFQANCNVTMR
jgi:hypothetical protein